MTSVLRSINIANLRAELEAQKAELAGPLEGMDDYVRVGNGVDGEKPMRAAAEAAAGDYRKRIAILDRALGVLHDLEADGFPVIPARTVPVEVLEQLRRNHATMGAALERFVLQPEPAVGGTIHFGAGVPKPAAPAARP